MNISAVPLALTGLLAIAGNIAGVVFLSAVPHAYKFSTIAAWHSEASAVPGSALASAMAFAIGLGAMAAFAMSLAQLHTARTSLASWLSTGAALIAAGALLNAAGSVLAGAAIRQDPFVSDSITAGRAMLDGALLADAAFNVLIGFGLILTNVALLRASGYPRWIASIGLAAGVASLPVGLQAVSDSFAAGIVISGSLWLVWIAAISLHAIFEAR